MDPSSPTDFPLLTVAEFLAGIAPNQQVQLVDAIAERFDGRYPFNTPEIPLWCANEACNRLMFFEPDDRHGVFVRPELPNRQFIQYRCKHCEQTVKHFAVLVWSNGEKQWYGTKLGETPPFGPVAPPRLLRLIGESDVYFRPGHRSESLGFGIGAFSYYRRVVEHAKDRLFDRIIEVAKRLRLDPAKISDLERAKANWRFSQAITEIKPALPAALLIEGHNPLTLLHSALSRGIHNESDAECLELARDIRLVLTALAERIASVLRDENELGEAVKRLSNPR